MRKNQIHVDKNLVYFGDNSSSEFSVVYCDVEVGLATVQKLAVMKGVTVTDFGIHQQFRQLGYAKTMFNILKEMFGEIHIEVLDINDVAYNAFTKIGFVKESHSTKRQVYYMSYGCKTVVKKKETSQSVELEKVETKVVEDNKLPNQDPAEKVKKGIVKYLV
ncbi:MAG: hypothetical protein RR744_00205 [Cellulosilyticaceae bacterium]